MQLVNDSITNALMDDLEEMVSTIRLVSGLGEIKILQPGRIYDENSRLVAVPVTMLKHRLGNGAQLTESGLSSDEPTYYANFVSAPVCVITDKRGSTDPFVDLLQTVFVSMSKQDYAMAFVSLQCFLLLIRICGERAPGLGPKNTEMKVDPYVI